MAVYTTLDRDTIEHLIASFNIGILLNYEGVTAGTDNTNYFITTDQSACVGEAHTQSLQSFVLTVFEHIDPKALASYVRLTTELNRYQLPVPCPLTDPDGCAIQSVEGKPALLVPKIRGRHPTEPSLSQCATIGTTMAQMHLCCQQLNLTLAGPRSVDWLQSCSKTVRPTLNDADQSLLNVIPRFFARTAQYPTLPQAMIHNDLFRDNALFDGEQLLGIIDFYHASYSYLLTDLAITVNDWCSDPSGRLKPEFSQMLVSAYNQFRPLSKDEKALWNDFLSMTAARFWVSRLAAKQHNPIAHEHGELGEHKDPNEYKAMLIHRLNQC